jgi:hypothetical protein
MSIRTRTQFTTIRTEGEILPPDLLQRVTAGDATLGGLRSDDYHLPKGEKINEAMNRSWNRLVGAWAAFRPAMERAAVGEPGTTLTRERWLLPLFQEMGYGRLASAKAIEIDGKSYPLSHGWQNTPIHLVGFGVDLDKRTPGVAGASRGSPHSLTQELLNRSAEHLWGFVSNGLRLRILRDNASLMRQAYVEFDLQAIMDGEVYADFALLWLLCHQSRVEAEHANQCWLEQWSRAAQEQGTRALDQLRDGVEKAINALGRGFLSHAANQTLREQLRKGDLSAQDYYRQLLRLVYRLIFLFTAEERDLLLDPNATVEASKRYTDYYSIARLRHLAERRAGTKHADLYHGLRLVMDKLGGDGYAPLALPALGSFLFSAGATPDLNRCELANHDLLDAIRALALTMQGRTRRLVDYKNLGSEEWGSVYTSLLELHPILNAGAGTFELRTAAGNERKTSGSYYTQAGLVNELIESALEPVIRERLSRARTPADKERALLSLKACDCALGSGHMMLAAARRIARHLAAVRTGDEEAAPEAMRGALRDVIGHCIYGVDINPMAVELCKVNLWMEALEPGKPLSFLDHHIKCGNSLMGATPTLLADGIPDEAFTPIEGDDKAVCTEFKKKNKKERESGQRSMFDAAMQSWERLGDLGASMLNLDELADDTIEDVRRKQELYESLVQSTGYEHGRVWADMWCAAFVWKKTNEFPYPITEEVFRRVERNPYPLVVWMRVEVERLRQQYQFFHWHLEFPDVFRLPSLGKAPDNAQMDWNGGFDTLLSNPPWERIKLQEEEFFAARDPQIAMAANKAARQKLINTLVQTNPLLAHDFAEAKRAAEAASKFVRASGRFPLTAVGDVNTYALFAEHARSVIAPHGRAGIIVPTGIATDDTTKTFFGDLSVKKALASLFDFENRQGLFPAVDSRMKFALLTMSGSPVEQSAFVFFATQVEHLRDERRRFTLSPDEIALFNPNTRTLPVFRTSADARLTKKIYQRVPVLENERTGENPWGIRFMTMFHMANDSGLFVTTPCEGYVPLYEAKLFHQFDHRWATYENGEARELRREAKVDPSCVVRPRYWVACGEVDEQLKGWEKDWLLLFRNVCRATDERTAIFSVIPRYGVDHSAPLVFVATEGKELTLCFIACVSALVFDYVVRQKLGGINMTFGYVRQFPFLSPTAYMPIDIDFIAPRVLELVYTAWDMKPFAEDMGYQDEPFRWDEDRRAQLRAELDAYYAKLYGLTRDELRYILDPKDVYGEDFPSETFRVLKEKEMRSYGEYRTRRLVLEKWDGMFGSR